jgi:hypothetical protein
MNINGKVSYLKTKKACIKAGFKDRRIAHCLISTASLMRAFGQSDTFLRMRLELL